MSQIINAITFLSFFSFPFFFLNKETYFKLFGKELEERGRDEKLKRM
jgi:hypothetical protein